MTDISVIVPTYNRPEPLTELVCALARQTLPPERWELIVVDDCSQPGSVPDEAELARLCPASLRLLRMERNGGPDRARNAGVGIARSPLIAFLDDDVKPDPGCLAAAIAAFEADPTVGVVQGRTRLPDGVQPSDLSMWTMAIDISGPSAFFQTCNIYYRAEALAAVGGVTEDLGMYGNDSATGWAVVEAGWGRAYEKDASAVHAVENRGFRWFLRNAWKEQTAVAVAARHRGYREEALWRPWGYRKKNVALVGALVSLSAATRWPPAAAGALPYLWWSRPSRHHQHYFRTTAQIALVDAVACAAHAVGSAHHRILVL